MNPQTPVFLAISNLTGAVDGEWFQVKPNGTSTIQIAISVIDGTGTWTVQGRNEPGDDVQTLDTGSADEAISVPRFKQMRVILTSATDLDFKATGDGPMRELEAF